LSYVPLHLNHFSAHSRRLTQTIATALSRTQQSFIREPALAHIGINIRKGWGWATKEMTFKKVKV